MWQELRQELRPKGLEVVTVALDVGGEQAAGPWIDLAKPEHPSLIDEAHLLDELLGIVNVPTGMWIDEEGMIVRPPEPAFPGRAVIAELGLPQDAPPRIVEMLDGGGEDAGRPRALRGRRARLGRARRREPLRPRPRRGRERSRPSRPRSSAGRRLLRARPVPSPCRPTDAAVRWFREAHRLQPDNWTYKRQAWEFVDPILQGPSEQYEGDWLSDVRAIGAENYYPPVDL